jgi:hypothetical protein
MAVMKQFSFSATHDARGSAGASPDAVEVCPRLRRLSHRQVCDLPLARGVALLVLLGLGLAGGCTHVVREDAHYFVDGKDQLAPPDGIIPAGTGVWIIGKDEDYKRVWTLEFVIGYVWQDSIVTQSEWRKIEKRRKEREEAFERRSEQPIIAPLGQR